MMRIRPSFSLFSFLLFAISVIAQTRPQRSGRESAPETTSQSSAGIITVYEQHMPADKAAPARRPVDLSQLYGLSAATHNRRIRLSDPDPLLIQRIRNEDAANPQKAARVGFDRPAKITLADGEWTDVVENGVPRRVWLLQLESPQAQAVRVHFRSFRLPPGVTLRLYTPAHPDFPLEFTQNGPHDSGEFWAPAVFGAEVQFELVDTRPDSLSAPGPVIEVDSIGHWFDGDFGSSSSCELDFTCYPDWSTTGSAAARLYFTDTNYEYVCSGSLLANNANDWSPFFLTAGHCIASQSLAANATIYWLDQTSTCNGAPPYIWNLPQNYGAQFLKTSTVADESLLLLNSPPPSGVTFAGWTNVQLPWGSAVSVIHHPHGDPKKITFGSSTLSGKGTIQVNYTNGLIEPGSSGGPLFNANHLLVGSVSQGGNTVCGYSSYGPDYYSEFASGFDALNDTGNANYLVKGMGGDQFDPNATQDTAAVLPLPFPLTNLIVNMFRQDWFAVTLPDSTRLLIQSKNLTPGNLTLFVNGGPTGSPTYFVPSDDSLIQTPAVLGNWTGSSQTIYLNFRTDQFKNNYQLGLQVLTPGLPIVTTGTSSVSQGVVQLGGTVDGNGAYASYYFEYDTDPSFQTSIKTTPTTDNVPTSPVYVGVYLQSLASDQTYYYRLVATNSAGTTTGAAQWFHVPVLIRSAMVMPNPEYFANTQPNGLAGNDLVIINTGNVNVQLLSVSSNSSAFIVGPTCSPFPCQANDIQLTFNPTVPGTYDGVITIVTDGGAFNIPVHGTCTTDVTSPLSISSTWLYFNGLVGQTTSAQSVQVTNPGTVPTTIFGLSAISRSFNTKTDCPSVLIPNATCNVFVTYHPLDAKASWEVVPVIIETDYRREFFYLQGFPSDPQAGVSRPERTTPSGQPAGSGPSSVTPTRPTRPIKH